MSEKLISQEDVDMLLPSAEKDERMMSHKLSTSHNFARLYLYLCHKIDLGKLKVYPVKLAHDFRNDYSYIYRLLTDMEALSNGTLLKIKKNKKEGGVFFVLKEAFAKKELIGLASKFIKGEV